MFTNCALVGVVKEKPVVEKSKNGNVYAHLMLECERPFQSQEGHVMKDQFKIILWKGIAEETADICKEGSILGVKGRLESHSFSKEGKTYVIPDIIAEKVRMIQY